MRDLKAVLVKSGNPCRRRAARLVANRFPSAAVPDSEAVRARSTESCSGLRWGAKLLESNAQSSQEKVWSRSDPSGTTGLYFSLSLLCTVACAV